MKYLFMILTLLSLPNSYVFLLTTYYTVKNCHNAKKVYHFYHVKHFDNGVQHYMNYCEDFPNANTNGYK